MAILSSDHLFEEADRLICPPPAGPPRQVDLRRAISASYYGVFHFVLTSAADEFIGVTKRTTPLYALVYRSVDHSKLRDLCNEAKKQNPIAKYAKYLPKTGFGSDLQAFSSAVAELQEKRHSADYDPSIRVKSSDAFVAVATARSAIERFKKADANERKVFLTLLLFPPRV